MIRVVIVDDEELARRGIRSLLARNSDIEVVAECGNVGQAAQAIKTHEPDLVFLDVQMSGNLGFEVMEHTVSDTSPYFIIVTAYDDFAIRAFDVQALDYLVKPVNEQRFELALERARSALADEHDGSVGRRLAKMAAASSVAPDSVGAAPDTDRIPVKTGGRVMVLRIAEVDWVKAEHDYVSLHVGPKAWLIRETIGAIEVRFANAGFVRIHRSTLVNIERVKELRPLDKGEFKVVLRDGVELKLSRNYRAALRRLAGVTF